MRASVRYLKDHLAQCLLEVQRGTEIIVTSHHSPVAKHVMLSFQEEDAQPTGDVLCRTCHPSPGFTKESAWQTAESNRRRYAQ